MSHGHLELIRLLGVSAASVRDIAKKVAEACAPTAVTVSIPEKLDDVTSVT